VIMSKLVKQEDWLSEECDNLARSGLRTLVFGMKKLKQEEYENWNEEFKLAKATIQNRAENVNQARMKLEKGMTLLGVSGVEDKLQENVQECIENLRNAGIKVWMLTGDKVETATCIARSTKLVSKFQDIFYLIADSPQEVSRLLDEFSTQYDSCLILDGDTLAICVEHLKTKFIEYSQKAPCVVCCRCAPTQKALIVEMIKNKTKKRVAAIGDGGNDVSMILAADVGIGIVGKEGKHASLAADFSINQFSFCQRLMCKKIL
jgi:phospholipid-translocating ATPase